MCIADDDAQSPSLLGSAEMSDASRLLAPPIMRLLFVLLCLAATTLSGSAKEWPLEYAGFLQPIPDAVNTPSVSAAEPASPIRSPNNPIPDEPRHQTQGRRIALVIGNSTYRNVNPLKILTPTRALSPTRFVSLGSSKSSRSTISRSPIFPPS